MNTNITEIQLGDLVGIDRSDDSKDIAAHFDKFDPIDFHFGTSFILGEDKADDLDFSKLYGIPLITPSKQVVEGAGGDDTINGGSGTDTAVYSDKFENYKIVKSGSSITIEHVAGTMADGKDTLTDVEVARFADRTVSLPLKDGPTMVKKEALLNDSGVQVGVGAVSMPTFMLDGDVDFQVTLSSSGVTKKYNFAFIIDVSGSMAGQPLAQAKQAYINLIDHLKSIGVAANSTFAVIPFSSSATLHGSLSADQASSLINTLTDLGGTNYRAGLEQANTYFNQTSSYNVTNVAYFLSDGEPDYGNAYQTAAQSLQTLADVRAFGIGNANLAPLNTVDSGNAELLKDSKDLGSAFVAAGLRKTDIAGLEVWLNGALVQRISPDQLTEDTLGLSYSSSLSGLSVAADAKNDISVRVVMADGKSTTTSIDSVVSVGDGSRASASSSGFDLDGDGQADAVLQSGNRFALWTLDDTDLKSGKIFKTVSDSNWRLQGAGDFSGDGKGDLLLKHDDGRIAVWTMNGEQITDGKVIKTLADNKWAIASTGDYDGDAVSDVMLKHQDGRVALWSMNNSDLSKGAVIKTLSDPNWKIAGTGDFDGNGRDELLLQHTNGNVATWSLDGHQLKSGAIVQAFQGAGWSVEGAGDFNGDASDDILLKNQDGRLSVWEMRLGKVAKSYDLDQLKDTSWQVANVADFNGDGRADVMFQHSDGRVATWLLDGSSRLHGGITNTLKDTSWSVLGNSRLV